MKNQNTHWLNNALHQLWQIRLNLGEDAAREAKPTDMGKRQTSFENDAVSYTRGHLPPRCVLQAEGWHYQEPDTREVEWIVGLDPTDGTAGDARFRGVEILKRSLPLSLVLTIRKNIADPTFASVFYAGILDLRSGQIFVADERGAFSSLPGESTVTLSRSHQYNRHAPTVAWEIARRALAPLRFLIPYELYPEMYSDSNSSAMVMLWSLLGYCDVWFNCVLPGITGAGQRGHELGAAAVFARELGACAYHTTTANGQIVIASQLDQAPYTFDGQTSVVLGVNQPIVNHYLHLINTTLKRQVSLGGEQMEVHKVLTDLYRDVPGKRWSLPLVRGE